MTFLTLARKGSQWFLLPFELELSPGLPLVHFLNSQDARLKESAVRVRTAFRQLGLAWPKTKSIVINFKVDDPSWTSDGFDLALAVALLVKLKIFRPRQLQISSVAVYGRITLTGQIEAPDDLRTYDLSSSSLLTGSFSSGFSQRAVICTHLSALLREQLTSAQSHQPDLECPALPNLHWSQSAADLMALIATGEHSALLAGPQGTGKSTFAECVHMVLEPPPAELWQQILKIGEIFKERRTFRPLRSPHHTTPVKSLLGGGRPLLAGEVTRAHGGVLLLDEFLEFDPEVQEGLREPLERGEIVLSRAGRAEAFPARFLLLAASNLCHCGKLMPKVKVQCGRSLIRCRSVVDRLSGPILDRIALLQFADRWFDPRGISLRDIRDQVKTARQFARTSRGQHHANSRLQIGELEATLGKTAQLVLNLGTQTLPRRRRNLLAVARTRADLQHSKWIEVHHITDAEQLVEQPRKDLAQLFA